ncbi:MAG: ImmA/IrrE family metallo-endopeptidase [Firmicutes bacterium]|nr:ImmA/IrrE family metallo-endopeptidase [Bacillota bacterium]
MEYRRRNARELYRCFLDLAKARGIRVVLYSLPSPIDGFYLGDRNRWPNGLIVLEKKLKIRERVWVLAHELGHYFMDKVLNIEIGNIFLKSVTDEDKKRRVQIEAEADDFARWLITVYGGDEAYFPPKRS